MQQLVDMSLNEYACRIIQVLIGKLSLKEQLDLIQGFKGRFVECVFNQHGNHVIQKIIQSVSCEYLGPLREELEGNFFDMSLN